MPDRVPTTSLTVDEAQARGALLVVHDTTVELDLTAPGDTFSSRTTITFGCGRPGAETFLDFNGELRSATLNGKPLPPEARTGNRLALSDLSRENTVEIDGVMTYSADGEGLHRHVDTLDQRTYLYAMSFLDAAPRWFACFDQPDLKSRYRFEVSAPPSWTVIGNGPSRRDDPGRWTIEPLQPLSTYFVTLVAGEYATVEAEHDGIPLAFHVRASLRDQLELEAPDMIEVTAQCLDYYHRTFGIRYPFGEYHQAFVPDFNAGAMENPGCVTLRDQFIFRGRATSAERASRAGVIAHEMAHMWFGDLVTMRWWDDLWLNESFAEFMAHRCCTEVTRYPLWAEFGIVRKDWGSIADQSPSTHPVAGNGAVDAAAVLQDFDGISYAKGASVLKQLVAYLGDETFFAGLRAYFHAHSFGNAAFADLIGAWTAAGAEELEHWAQVWLQTSGMDLLSVGDQVLERTSPDATRRPHALTVGFFDGDGTSLGREDVRLDGGQVGLSVPPGTELVLPDVGDDTWARIRFGDVEVAQVGPLMAAIEDSSARVVMINSVRDGVRSADIDPADALTVLLQLATTERSDAVLASTLRFAVDQLAGPYVAPQQRPGALLRIRELIAAQLAIAPPGSDHQLTLFRMALRVGDDPDLLRDQLRGRRLPPGVDLDPDLEWSVVDRLVVLGADIDLIERQLVRDQSASAHVHAARSRAGLPHPESKAEVWRILVDDAPINSYELYATAEGFFRAEQDELCRPYAARYFHEIPEVARFRSGWVLGRLVQLAYPSTQSSSDVLELAERTLEGHSLATAVRRSMIDATDALRRAVSSRNTFGHT